MSSEHIVNAIQHHELVSDSTLHVVAVISNTQRYHSRYRLFRQFQEEMRKTANVKLHVVELAFGDRNFEVTGQMPGASELRLRTQQEIWHKENMINLGVKHLLPTDWKYLCWCDGDVVFSNPNWALETIHTLQHAPVCQPWSECIDLGPHGEAMSLFRSFASLVQKGVKQQVNSNDPYPYGHSGFAVACTRHFWENVGGLMEFPILGSADHHMCWAMLGKVEWSVHQGVSDSYKRLCTDWQSKAFRETNGHLMYVPGKIEHRFHGPKAARRYRERWQILVDSQYDPDKDLRKDQQGVLMVVNKPHMLADIRRYFRERNEDSIDT